MGLPSLRVVTFFNPCAILSSLAYDASPMQSLWAGVVNYGSRRGLVKLRKKERDANFVSPPNFALKNGGAYNPAGLSRTSL